VDQAFGSAFTVGIEEELLLVDPETRRLAAIAAEILSRMEMPEATASHEAYAAQIELRSPPCRAAADARAALASARAAARGAGATLLGAGLHPAAEPGETAIVDAERYRRVADAMRGLFGRTPECALHVHVGMPDTDAAIRAYNGLRAQLPLLQALTASSPWWFGRDSGLASARYSLVRSYPGRGVPPAFRDFEDYATHVERECAAADVGDYTLLWWDVRPHPRLGTVEVREMDAQSSVEDCAGVAALIQGLAAAEAESAADELPSTQAIGWSCFRAARDGLEATILQDGSLTPAREVARAAVERARPFAADLGSEAALDRVERLVAEGGGAGRQRAAHARGGMDGLLDHLVRETAAA